MSPESSGLPRLCPKASHTTLTTSPSPRGVFCGVPGKSTHDCHLLLIDHVPCTVLRALHTFLFDLGSRCSLPLYFIEVPHTGTFPRVNSKKWCQNRNQGNRANLMPTQDLHTDVHRSFINNNPTCKPKWPSTGERLHSHHTMPLYETLEEAKLVYSDGKQIRGWWGQGCTGD